MKNMSIYPSVTIIMKRNGTDISYISVCNTGFHRVSTGEPADENAEFHCGKGHEEVRENLILECKMSGPTFGSVLFRMFVKTVLLWRAALTLPW